MEVSTESIIKTSNRPKVPKGTHPIEHGDYILYTVSINELLDSVIKWIQLRNPGAIIYGPPRLGKTWAIKYLKKYFEFKYPNQWYMIVVKAEKFKKPNEDRFFESILKSVGHLLYNNGKTSAKRDRLTNFLIDKGENVVRKQIILFIDDAQRYTDYEYEWLMDIYNELESYGITLTTILVGQAELSFKRSTYLISHKQIVGRFMIQEKRFYGLQDFEELVYLLTSYDSVTEYPQNSGWSYTNFFFPIGFANGKRLENSATDLWNSISELRTKAGISSKTEIPMHYLISIINYVLLKFGFNEECVEWPTINMWKEAIIETGYLSSEVIFLERKD